MPQGLAVSRLIRVSVNLSPIAAPFANFDSLLIIGDSDVINVKDRIRSYGGLSAVATDFGTTAPEYLAAQLFFSQVPTPSQLYIGRWAQGATHGHLVGGPLTVAQQALTNFNTIAVGGFKIAVDGGALINVTGISLTGISNLNAVATAINAALTAATVAASVAWNGTQFDFQSTSTGAASAIAPLVAPTSGSDLSVLLKATAATLSETAPGIAAESAVNAVNVMDTQATQWYGLMFASTHITNSDHLAIAGYIEGDGANAPHLYGVTTADVVALTTGDVTSIGAQLKALGYNRTFSQYSSTQPYAVASLFGRGTTVDFSGNNTVITFMWKQEPGVIAEGLTSTQADALDANNYNYFGSYNNGTAIVVNGKMASGVFIDEMWDLDFGVNQVQTDVYNLLYTSPTKVPQTDPGANVIKTTIEAGLSTMVNNGTLAPGIWDQPGFGQIAQGDFLPKGFYVFAPPLASQPKADREARKSVPFQAAAKMAGAVHSVAITINVNR
jgi:hypothetical protein